MGSNPIAPTKVADLAYARSLTGVIMPIVPVSEQEFAQFQPPSRKKSGKPQVKEPATLGSKTQIRKGTNHVSQSK